MANALALRAPRYVVRATIERDGRPATTAEEPCASYRQAVDVVGLYVDNCFGEPLRARIAILLDGAVVEEFTAGVRGAN